MQGLRTTFLCTLWLLTGCQLSNTNSVSVMPEPAIWANAESPARAPVDHNIWYVTDRAAGPDNSTGLFSGERSNRLTVGTAQIDVTSKSRSRARAKQRLEIVESRVLGHLATALPYGFLTGLDELNQSTPVDQQFAQQLNAQLEASTDGDIYIYVHGYRSVFENPILLSSQLWRYMEYDGAFLSFSWPSTPRRLAYFKDLETAQLSGHSLRLLIEYLSTRTKVNKINIIGYSAGTRVVLTALHEIALTHRGANNTASAIGRVALIASDYDRNRWATSVSVGLMDVVEHMTIYLSQSDTALALSSFLLGEMRLGQLAKHEEASTATARGWLEANPKLTFVDVTNAEKSSLGNGHAYFKQSPWASSDLILALKHGLAPNERGLTRPAGEIPWRFPPTYELEAQDALSKINSTQVGAK